MSFDASTEARFQGSELAEHGTRRVLLRAGAVCAILGAIISVSGGIAVGNVSNSYEPAAALRYLAERPLWYWPIGHLGFIIGALLWVVAFIAFVRWASPGASRVAAQLAAAIAMVGATVHIVDSLVSGYALNLLAHTWAEAAVGEQAELFRIGLLLLWTLDGTWSGVLVFFHGVPFLLAGLALIIDSRLPSWLGWPAAVAGVGSIVAGVSGYLDSDIVPEVVFVICAVLVSIWMAIVGVLMWRHSGPGVATIS